METNPHSSCYLLSLQEVPQLLIRVICGQVAVHHLAEVLCLSPAHGVLGVEVGSAGAQAGEYPTIAKSRY